MTSTLAMNNQRRRRDMLLIMTLIASSMEVMEKPKYKTNVTVIGPFRHIPALTKQHMAAMPNERERKREQDNIKMVVNTITPGNYGSMQPEVRLWFAAQLVYRLVGSGWRPQNDEIQMEFVQSIYNLAQGFPPLEVPPTKGLTDMMPALPEALKAMGLFR
jgi:hypothetical protein